MKKAALFSGLIAPSCLCLHAQPALASAIGKSGLNSLEANQDVSLFATQVPEPTTLGIVAAGLVIFALVQKIRR